MKRKICILNFGVNCPSLWPCDGEKLFSFFFLSEKPEMSVPEFYLVHFKWKEPTCFEDQTPRVRAQRRRALKPHDLEWQWLDSSAALRLFHRRGIVDAETVEKKNKTAFKNPEPRAASPVHRRRNGTPLYSLPSSSTVASYITGAMIVCCRYAGDILSYCMPLVRSVTNQLVGWFAKKISFHFRAAQRKTPIMSPSGSQGCAVHFYYFLLEPATTRPIKMCPNQQLAAGATCINACCTT